MDLIYEVVWLVLRFPKIDEDGVESKVGEPDLSCYSLLSLRKTRQHTWESVKDK